MRKITEVHPSLKLQCVNVADLRQVPSQFVKMVTPILNSVDKKNRSKSLAAYAEAQEGKLFFNGVQLYFVPDYKGSTLSLLGFEDANWTFRVSLVLQGKVLLSLQSSSRDFSGQFEQCIEEAVKQMPALVSDDIEKTSRGIEYEQVVIGRRGKHDTKLSVAPGAQWLAWDFFLSQSEHLEFSLFFTPTDQPSEEEIRVPNTVATAKEGSPTRGCFLIDKPGTFTLRLSNSMSRFSSKTVNFKFFAV